MSEIDAERLAYFHDLVGCGHERLGTAVGVGIGKVSHRLGLRGMARPPQRISTLEGQRKECHETFRKVHISFELDRFQWGSAVNDPGHRRRRPGKGDVTILRLAPGDIQAPVVNGRNIGRLAEAKPDARVEAFGALG